jgi:hypothetical protein
MSNMAMGVFLTLLGLILTLDSLHVVDASAALRFWPIGFHVLGATILLRRSDSQGRFWGIAWIGVGTWLLLNSLGLTNVSFFDLLWPLLLVFVGVRLILRGRSSPTSPAAPGSTVPGALGPTATTAAGSAMPNLVAVLGESKGAVHQTFTGASLTSFMGGCHLDLRHASIAPGEVPTIDVFVVMGGQEIAVPAGWAVDLDVMSVMAGSEDKRLPTVASTQAAAPRLRIRGFMLFGGLTVTN